MIEPLNPGSILFQVEADTRPSKPAVGDSSRGGWTSTRSKGEYLTLYGMAGREPGVNRAAKKGRSAKAIGSSEGAPGVDSLRGA